MMRSYSNVLIVTGSGRNVGKTSFVCQVIEKFAKQRIIIAVKITPHFHKTNGCKLMIKNVNYQIIEESELHGKKDTSKMLIAGANRAFLIQTDDSNVKEAFDQVLNIINDECLIVCESGGVINHLQPGLSVYITTEKSKNDGCKRIKSNICLNEQVIFSDYLRANISLSEDQWTLSSSGN